MKLSNKLSERQKQDDKAESNFMSKTLRAGTEWGAQKFYLFSAPKSMLDLRFCYCKVMVHGQCR